MCLSKQFVYVFVWFFSLLLPFEIDVIEMSITMSSLRGRT